MLNIIKAITRASQEVEQGSTPCLQPAKPTKLETLCEQIIDSGIVGGITWISTLIATNGDLNALSFVVGFGLTFLIKMKEYRKVA